MTENEFPTIADLRDRLSELAERGLGELPVQVLIVPDSTLQAIARDAGGKDDAKPALMIDLMDDAGNSVTIMSTDRMSSTPTARHAVQ
jgi:hypothetical protein